VDWHAETVLVTSTLIRVKGEGLLRKGTKTQAGERTLPLPVSAVALLRRRFMTGARLDQPLFPDVLGGFRDPANVRRELREARGTETLAWITSHTFRKTAATILDEAALSARLVADQLGHSRPS
jgi:integrase